MRSETVILCIVIIFCSHSIADNSTSTVPQHSTTTPTPLKCTRDYHCLSKCDVCLSGICVHQKPETCTRDYHCTRCEVCRSGKCIPGDRSKKCETKNDCDIRGWCLDGKCAENKCGSDADCGTSQKAVCKSGVCELI